VVRDLCDFLPEVDDTVGRTGDFCSTIMESFAYDTPCLSHQTCDLSRIFSTDVKGLWCKPITHVPFYAPHGILATRGK
jgi:hypothetical protein